MCVGVGVRACVPFSAGVFLGIGWFMSSQDMHHREQAPKHVAARVHASAISCSASVPACLRLAMRSVDHGAVRNQHLIHTTR